MRPWAEAWHACRHSAASEKGDCERSAAQVSREGEPAGAGPSSATPAASSRGRSMSGKSSIAHISCACAAAPAGVAPSSHGASAAPLSTSWATSDTETSFSSPATSCEPPLRKPASGSENAKFGRARSRRSSVWPSSPRGASPYCRGRWSATRARVSYCRARRQSQSHQSSARTGSRGSEAASSSLQTSSEVRCMPCPARPCMSSHIVRSQLQPGHSALEERRRATRGLCAEGPTPVSWKGEKPGPRLHSRA
mmetsp:Transcript_78130/g.168911  ORF Transcript_78130/g.168911 Transcript_78130/m.168911 type:complete len:252 (+) Transcript_78130:81-836(+)